MRAKITTGYGTGGKRQILKDILPLDTPLVIDYFPVNACNFKCKFCVCSLDLSERGFNFEENFMSLDTFKKSVDDLKKFPQKLKMLRFVGVGEPLLHNKIDEMIKYAFEQNVADKVEVITNGSLLTNEMSDRLISSGLTQIRISVEGLSSEAYKEIADVEFDFSQFVENLRYLYKHKGSLKINIKCIDYSLKNEKEIDNFYKIFGDICDTISIENMGRASSKVDYTPLEDKLTGKTLRGNPFEKLHICPFPYYLMQINPDGSIYPCCSLENPSSMGNCKEESLYEIWNGEVFSNFRVKMLDGTSNCGAVCSRCEAYLYSIFPEDKITKEDAEQLKKKYGAYNKNM